MQSLPVPVVTSLIACCWLQSSIYLFIYLKFHDAVKVVSIHKSNRFGIKNWSLFFFFFVRVKFDKFWLEEYDFDLYKEFLMEKKNPQIYKIFEEQF